MPNFKLLCAGVVFSLLLPVATAAQATELVRFFVKTSARTPQQVVDDLQSFPFANCKAFSVVPFSFDEVAVGVECNEHADIFIALSQIAVKLEGVKSIGFGGPAPR